ncbi:MAG: hypothetical protein QXH81_03575 [Thermofilaceae archaeon]
MRYEYLERQARQWEQIAARLDHIARLLETVAARLAAIPAPAPVVVQAAPAPAPAPAPVRYAYEVVRGAAPVAVPGGGESVLYTVSGSGALEFAFALEEKAGTPSLALKVAVDGTTVTDIASGDYLNLLMPPVSGFGGMLFHERVDGVERVAWVRQFSLPYTSSLTVSVVNTDRQSASTLKSWILLVRRAV